VSLFTSHFSKVCGMRVGATPARVRPKWTDINPCSFDQLGVPASILTALDACGFIQASPVQQQVLPEVLSGASLIFQAQSGSGKTLIFCVSALKSLLDSVDLSSVPQVLILVSSREVAVQIHQVLSSLVRKCHAISQIKCDLFIGGMSVKSDVAKFSKSPVNVVIGTCGRIQHLIEIGAFSLRKVSLLVLDEADALVWQMKESGLLSRLTSVFHGKQTLAVSATFSPESLDLICSSFSIACTVVVPSSDALESAIRHSFICASDQTNDKLRKLVTVLEETPFHQCVVFTNNKSDSEDIASFLYSSGWPASSIAGDLEQRQRSKIIDDIRAFKLRILVATDLISRGFDLDRISLVVNLDLPKDCDTYLHRSGRTGRFGSTGCCVSIVNESEIVLLRSFSEIGCFQLHPFGDVRNDFTVDTSYFSETELKSLSHLTQFEGQVSSKERMHSISVRGMKAPLMEMKGVAVPFPWNQPSLANFPISYWIFPASPSKRRQ